MMKAAAGIAAIAALAGVGLLTSAVQAVDSTTTYDSATNLTNGMQVPSSGAETFDNITVVSNAAVNVTGGVLVGRTTLQPQPPYVDDLTSWRNMDLLTIGDGTTATTLTLRNSHSNFESGYIDTGGIIYGANSVVNLAVNATLALRVNINPAAGGSTTVVNWGNWNQAGKISLGPNLDYGNSATVTTYGVFTVQGTAATIERVAGPSGVNYTSQSQSWFMPYSTQGSAGTLTGTGRLSYLNSTGDSDLAIMKIIDAGIIKPGTNGMGTLELTNANVSMNSGSTVEIGLGGTGTGEFGVLKLDGSGGQFNSSGSGNHLVIDKVNGFQPKHGDTWTFLYYNSMTLFGNPAAGFKTVTPLYDVTYYSTYATLTFNSKPGDANGDGKIDGADLAIWQQNYDPSGAHGAANTWEKGDWNNDDHVDGADLALWQQNYNPSGVGQGAPEPATMMLLGLGALAVLRRGRSRK